MNENLLILIAEDNDDDGYLVQHALKKAGLPTLPTFARMASIPWTI